MCYVLVLGAGCWLPLLLLCALPLTSASMGRGRPGSSHFAKPSLCLALQETLQQGPPAAAAPAAAVHGENAHVMRSPQCAAIPPALLLPLNLPVLLLLVG